MKVLNNPLKTYENSLLYKELLSRNSSAAWFISTIQSTIDACKQLQKLIIAGPFRDYTLHDETHSLKLVNLADNLICEETIRHLSSMEILLLFVSFYLHDLGMVLTEYERKNLIATKEFSYFKKSRSDLQERLDILYEEHELAEEPEKTLLSYKIYELNEAMLSEFLRPKHASKENYTKIITGIKKSLGNSSLFTYNSIPFEKYIIELCHSHNEAANYLIESNGIHDDIFPKRITYT